MDCEFKWHRDASVEIKERVNKIISEFISSSVNQLEPCHDDPLQVSILEADPFYEIFRGTIYCSCREPLGRFDCNASGMKLNVSFIKKG